MGQRIYISFIFYFFLVHSVSGQARFNVLPVQFFQVPQNNSLVNPSYMVFDSAVSITMGNKMNFGSFKIFRTHYFNATFRRDSERKPGKSQGFGLTVITDKEGDYLQRNRLYLMYAYKIGLSSRLSLSAGSSLGLVNHSIESSNIHPGGSSMVPDGNVGICLSADKAYLGFSIAQLFGNKLTPFKETSVLLRHVNVIAGKRIFLSPNLDYACFLSARAAKEVDLDLDVVNKLLIHKILSAGLNYRYKKSLVFMMGFENIALLNGRHLAGGWFSYSVPFKKYVMANIQTYEITLSYKII